MLHLTYVLIPRVLSLLTTIFCFLRVLKLKGNCGSKRQHVHGYNLVRARKLYGYHSSEELFIKIYLYPYETEFCLHPCSILSLLYAFLPPYFINDLQHVIECLDNNLDIIHKISPALQIFFWYSFLMFHFAAFHIYFLLVDLAAKLDGGNFKGICSSEIDDLYTVLYGQYIWRICSENMI